MKKLALISVVGLILTGCGGSDSKSVSEETKQTPQPPVIKAINVSGKWAAGETLTATIECTECIASMTQYHWSIDGKDL